MDPTILLTPIVLISIVIFVAWPLLKQYKDTAPEGISTNLETATEEKEAVLTILKDLEMDFRMGKLSEEDYQSSRRELEERALKALDHIDSLKKNENRPGG